MALNKMNYFDDVTLVDKLRVYEENFDSKKLNACEEAIFSNKVNKKRRASLELNRIRSFLIKDIDVYKKYVDDFRNISELIKVSDFDPTALEQAYKLIVRIQLANGINVRLYSAISMLLEEYSISDKKLKMSK